MDDFFTHNLHCWVERFRNFAHIGRPPMADGVTKIVNILHDEMHALSDPWKWEGRRSTCRPPRRDGPPG